MIEIKTKDVAELFNVTRRSVQLWVKNGGCPQIARGCFDLKAVFDFWNENINRNGGKNTDDKTDQNIPVYYRTKDVAEFFGITTRAVQLWVKDGGCPQIARGKFDLKAVFDFWDENINNGGRESGDESYRSVRTSYWKAKSELERIKVEKESGRVVEKTIVFKNWAKRILVMVSALRQLPIRLAASLEGKGRVDRESIIREEIEDMIVALTRFGKHYPEIKNIINSNGDAQKKKPVKKKPVKKKPVKKRKAKK